MAQPHQYHGEGGAAPVWPGEGTTGYRDGYRPDPFVVGLQTAHHGLYVDVERDTIMRFTQAIRWFVKRFSFRYCLSTSTH